jgi:hypothetical protein
MVVIIVEFWAHLVARFLLFRSDFDKASKPPMGVLECFDINMEAGSSSTSSVTVYQSILHHMVEKVNPFRNSRHKLHEK